MNIVTMSNELFEKAKHAYGTGAYDDATLEFLFPQLKESEGERIRKEIMEFIAWAEGRGSVRKDFHEKKRPYDWIAWLEKQKEQKPVEWKPLQEPEVDLEKEIEEYTEKNLHLPITGQVEPMDIMESDWVRCARHFYKLGKTAK